MNSETSVPEVIVENMPEYDDSNRAFLQAFMARSSMTFEDAQPILAAILTVSGTSLLLKPVLWMTVVADVELSSRRANSGP